MKIELGIPKALDHVTRDDVVRDPVWVWALADEAVDGQDETWQQPILQCNSVSEEVIRRFKTVTVTLCVVGTNSIASGEYDGRTGALSALSVWVDGAWVPIEQADLPEPILLKAVPTILGVDGLDFQVTDASTDTATPLVHANDRQT